MRSEVPVRHLHLTVFAASIRADVVCRARNPSRNSLARITPSEPTIKVPGFGTPSAFPLADSLRM